MIVESPSKAKTIAGFLGHDFVVEASVGHIRDLPRNAADVPAEFKGSAWARLGVDVDNGFTPLYVVAKEKKSQVAKLREALKGASELYLATDEDREGESIAWHLLEVLKPKVPVKRMVFHEITRPAIERAVNEWRELDRALVDAQEARRILDRLYGYEVSPVLWKKIMPGLSAGRVQSVAVRLIVERERARMRFVSAGYWDLIGRFTVQGAGAVRAAQSGSPDSFQATLVTLDGRRVATGRDFDQNGQLTGSATIALGPEQAAALVGGLTESSFTVRSTEEKPYRRSPYAPFMTSTLQQEAGRKLRFSSQRTMSVAQRLYENGYITYMRTDSTTLSETALSAARAQAAELYGREYVPDTPRRYEKKVKNAQEAHEAIRPAGEVFRTPEAVSRELGGDELRLYDLIWKRTVASQMADARGLSLQVRVGALTSRNEDVEFAASGKTITFPGFLRAYVEGADDPDAELEDQEVRLPQVEAGEPLAASDIEAVGHKTNPPARYTEASLVKALDEMGVGRPSTYASIMETVQNRGYVWKKGTALIPSFTAFAVVGLLEQHFGDLVDYEFTARMEDDLDQVAAGTAQSRPWLTSFYFGDGRDHTQSALGLKTLVLDRLGDIDAADINTIFIGVDDDGVDVVVKPGRYGPYVKRGDETASVPEDLPPDELTVAKAIELLSSPKSDRVVGVHPELELPVYAKAGRFGPYVQAGEPSSDKKAAKPPTSSLFKSMSVDTITLEQAVALLSLPRTVGVDPVDNIEIRAQNGRYGPYISKGADSRSLTSEEELLTISLPEALAVMAQPKMRRGQQSASTAPVRTVGDDPFSGQPIALKDGRFGPYVTDGTTNASLRRGDNPETITNERAVELLAERRIKDASAPPKSARGGRAGGAKKAAPKKAGAPKKAAVKKAAAPKSAAPNRAAAKKVAVKKGAAKKAAVKKTGGLKKVGETPKMTGTAATTRAPHPPTAPPMRSYEDEPF